MEKEAKTESHISSAAAFVEGGIQEACDDACSICLESFCDSDPSTVTGCKHEFHLQCILEWCQRSSQCPMCWQPITLKDPTSQELLEAVEHERSLRLNQSRNATILHHPALGDFELQHLPMGTSDAELEERIIQHLAAAAAMGRARHLARRDGHRRSGGQGHPQFLIFSAHPNAPHVGPNPASDQRGRESDAPSVVTDASPSIPQLGGEETLHQVPQAFPTLPSSPSQSSVSANRPGHSTSWNSAGQSTPGGQDRAGPSDFQSFSESLKSRFNAASMRYKESLAKSTRGWKERFFSRNTSVAELGSEVRREINAGINTVSRMIERLDTRETNRAEPPTVLDTRETNRAEPPTVSHGVEGNSVAEQSNVRIAEAHTENIPKDPNPSASVAATSSSD